jgi:hypothetical protein
MWNKYDPHNPLSDDQIDKLSEEELFAYLDSKAKYLSQFAEPLDEYHTKQFLSLSTGRVLTDEELKSAKEIGRIGNEYRNERISKAATSSYDLRTKVKKRGSAWID